MPGHGKADVLVALEEVRGKPRSPTLPNINDCGDGGLAIARDGAWFHEGGEIKRQPLVKLFSTVLRREGDGRYFLVTPVEKVPIAVADAPFIAVSMRKEGTGKEQKLSFTTNVDDMVMADREHPLRFGAGGEGPVPYILVREGLEAKLTRALYYELAALATAEDGARPGVWSGGVFFPFPSGAEGEGA